MTVHVYTRCMDGHFFSDAACPIDGYSSEVARTVADALDRLRLASASLGDVRPTLAGLQEAGVPERILKEVLIIEEEFVDWPPALPIEVAESRK